MGAALELLTFRSLNPGAALVAVTNNTGDSPNIRSFNFADGAFLQGVWAQEATAGIIRLRSARLHDNVQGIRFRTQAAVIRNLLADQLQQRLYPQDTLTVEIAGGAAETDSMSVLVQYANLPGIDARLYTWEQLRPRVVNLLTVEVAVAGPATAGDWSAGTNLNATFDLLKPNVDYAILGYQTDTACNAIAVRGGDTGNLRVGGPGPLEPIETRDWFVSLSTEGGFPAIPVINAAGRASTQAFVALNTAAGTVNVDFVLAELSPGA